MRVAAKTMLLAAAMVASSAASVARAETAHQSVPNPAHCPPTPPLDSDGNERKAPLKIPAAFAAMVKSDRTHLAITTLTGGTFCQDIHAVTKADTYALSADRRFFSFDWYGYEEGGHVIVDRTGRGQAIDSGAVATLSPTGRRFAAVQFSEAGFGALEGFGVWQINPVGVRQLALLRDIPALVDWRIDSWSGEDCVNLSGIPNERVADGNSDYRKFARDRYIARPAGGTWRLTRASRLGCPKE